MKLKWQAPVIKVISLEDTNANGNGGADITGQS